VSKTKTALLTPFGAALTFAIVAGMGMLWRYSLMPGVAGAPPALWPTQTHLARKAGALTLVMVVYPRCSCSRASLKELATSATVGHGHEACLFGAATWGQTMVYGRDGRLLFSGGITAARGHYGDNAGTQAIAALLERRWRRAAAAAPRFTAACSSRRRQPGASNRV
jgi:hypothetical protein